MRGRKKAKRQVKVPFNQTSISDFFVKEKHEEERPSPPPEPIEMEITIDLETSEQKNVGKRGRRPRSSRVELQYDKDQLVIPKIELAPLTYTSNDVNDTGKNDPLPIKNLIREIILVSDSSSDIDITDLDPKEETQAENEPPIELSPPSSQIQHRNVLKEYFLEIRQEIPSVTKSTKSKKHASAPKTEIEIDPYLYTSLKFIRDVNPVKMSTTANSKEIQNQRIHEQSIEILNSIDEVPNRIEYEKMAENLFNSLTTETSTFIEQYEQTELIKERQQVLSSAAIEDIKSQKSNLKTRATVLFQDSSKIKKDFFNNYSREGGKQLLENLKYSDKRAKHYFYDKIGELIFD